MNIEGWRMGRFPSSSILQLLQIITYTGGAVENHNALRHDGGAKYQFGLESKWGTNWWTI